MNYLFIPIIVLAIFASACTPQVQTELEEVMDDTVEEVKTVESKFQALLYEKEYYQFPFGAAEIEAYYTTAERSTSLDGSTPDVTCSALVITDGPPSLLEALSNTPFFGTPTTVVIGAEISNWGEINESTPEDPVKLLVTLNPTFEGELIGCMSWPFDTFTLVD